MKLRKLLSALNLSAASAGLLFAGVNASAQDALSTNLISFTTFEPDAPATWSYGYYYGNNGFGFYENSHAYYHFEDLDMTNAMFRFAFDNTDLIGTTGYGTGGGGPFFLNDPAGFITPERSNYILTFDARVEGLAEGQTTANAEMQVQFFMPNETGGTTKSYHVNLPFNPTSEWTTFQINLGDGSVAGDVNAPAFETNYTATSALQFNVNIHEPHNQFGYDWDNALFLDNLKFEVIDKPTTPPVETTPVTMAEWNFDDSTVGNIYNYQWSANASSPIVTAGNNANGGDPNTVGKDGTSGWFLTMDNSEFVFDPPAWAGGGSGGNGPVDFTLFNSPDLALYRVSFDARVEGLGFDRTTLNSGAFLQLHMDAPDDTFSPADEDADADFVIRLDVPIAGATTEWQSYTMLLSKANVGGGSKDLFSQHHSAISGLRTQWQIENIASEGDWGFDTDNTLVIDNFKLERLIPVGAEPNLNMARNDDQLVLTWTTPQDTSIRLQSTADLGGQWSDVTGATSGHTVDTTSGNIQFFRLVQE